MSTSSHSISSWISSLSPYSNSKSSQNDSRYSSKNGHVGRSSYTPAELLRTFSLPVAAYLKHLDLPPGIDPKQPFLLYKNYSSTKVKAVSLQVTQENGAIPVGPTLVIPDTYSGWFSVVNSKGRIAPFYSTIEELSRSRPTYFLTRFEIPAYVQELSQTEENRRITYRKITIQSGQVLKLLGVFEDVKKTNKSHKISSNYIQCLTHRNEGLYKILDPTFSWLCIVGTLIFAIVFIPFSATGKFYETAPRNSNNTNHVFLLSQILGTFQLPLTVRLVCGFMARVPDNFTGLLRLERVEKEAVILASTITPQARATLLEMDISSSFLLKPITDHLYAKSPIFLKTISFCQEEADSWRRQIKIIHNVVRNESSFHKRLKTPKTHRSNSLNINLPFVNKVRSRTKERSNPSSSEVRSASVTRDQPLHSISTNHFSMVPSPRHSISNEKTPKNRESRIRSKVFDRFQDMSPKNKNCIVNNEFISIKIEEKIIGKKQDKRKIAKQNTYVLQNEKLQKNNEKNNSDILDVDVIPKRHYDIFDMTESQEYATVADDITKLIMGNTNLQATDSIYSEICKESCLNIPVRAN